MKVAVPVMALDGNQEMWDSVPEHLQEGLARYLDHGDLPGAFLVACLSNDLVGAVCRAHMALTLEDLRKVATFLFTAAPAESWGDKDRVGAWRNNPTRLRLMHERKESA